MKCYHFNGYICYSLQYLKVFHQQNDHHVLPELLVCFSLAML